MPRPSRAASRKRSRRRTQEQDLIFREQLSRNEQFFKRDGQARIERAYVCVVGVGGVGSHAAHMLARAGVRRLRLVDFDQVTLSSLNRHAVATREDVGLTKVEACRRHFLEFNPRCKIEALPRMFTADAAEELVLGPPPQQLDAQEEVREDPDGTLDDDGSQCPDYVVDCIDDAVTKAALVAFCLRKGIRMICSLAAGGKSDPTRLRIGDLGDPMRDPLARKLRATLRKSGVWSFLDDGASVDGGRRHVNRKGVLPSGSGISCVYSTQNPVCPLEPLTKEQRDQGAHQFGAIENMRVRVMPVLGTVPALFGLAAASFVLCELSKTKDFEPLATRKVSMKTIRKVRERLKRRETDVYGVERGSPLNVSEDDVAYVLEHVWRLRCAYTGIHMEGSRAKKMVLCRWDRSLAPDGVRNLVLLTEGAADAHEKATELTGTVPGRLLSRKNEEDGDGDEEVGSGRGEDDGPSLEVLRFVQKAVVMGSMSEYDFPRVKYPDGSGMEAIVRNGTVDAESPLGRFASREAVRLLVCLAGFAWIAVANSWSGPVMLAVVAILVAEFVSRGK